MLPPRHHYQIAARAPNISTGLSRFARPLIIISQDPEPLLEILPRSALTLHNVIRVFWLGKKPTSYTDLSPFLLVREHRVLAALQYLVQRYQVYQNPNHQPPDARLMVD
jgi:hypothetical protein